jgi:hypothetical protein
VLLPLRINLEGVGADDISVGGGTLAEVLVPEPIPGYYTSTILPDQLPEFVGLEHGTFVEFLREYYRWMETGVTHGGTGAGEIHTSQHLADNRDPDENIDFFFDMMKKELLGSFPESFEDGSNKRTVMKNIRSFYRAKGSVDSVKFLFKILFDTESEIYTPKEDIIKASMGDYKSDKQILVSSSSGASIYECEGQMISQFDPIDPNIRTASAGVKRAVRYVGEGYDFFTLELDAISGTFNSSLPTEIPTDNSTVTEKILPVIGSISINDGGEKYGVGDSIKITGTRGRGGRGYVSSVKSISSGFSAGAINTIDILDYGVNFIEGDGITVEIDTKDGTNASIGVSGGGSVHMSRGFYGGSDHLVSSKSKMQDNHYYQDFSYVVRSGLPLYKYKNTIKKIIHPAGYVLFGDYLLSYTLLSDSSISGSTIAFETPIIGHYTPYNLESWENLRDNSQSTDLFPNGFSGDLEGSFSESGTVAHVLGASGPLGDEDNPGGTINQPQCNQLKFVDTDSITADYWLIYPHPNTRTISGSSYGGGITNADDITMQSVVVTHPAGDTTISVGDYVYQNTGIFTPEAQGIVVSADPVGPGWERTDLDIATYSNDPFMASGINTGHGGTSGLLYSVTDTDELSGWTMGTPTTITTQDYDGLTSDFKPLVIKEFHRKITR